MAKMTMKKFEKSGADKKMDKKKGMREGTKADMKADRASMKKGRK